MRVLFVTPYLPTQPKARPHHFIRELAHRGHEVHVLALVPRGQAKAAAEQPGWPDIRREASVTVVDYDRGGAYRRCARALPSRTALRVAYCAAPALVHAVEDLAARIQPDVVHVDRERLGPTIAPLAVPKVLDATDSLSLYNARLVRYGSGFERLLALVDLQRMAHMEAAMGAGYASILVTAAHDAAVIARKTPTPVVTIPNGVSSDFTSAERRPVRDRLVFVGNLSYPPNVDAVRWFVSHVLRTIVQRRPEAELHLVGIEPGRAVRDLARRHPAVRLVGAVPDVVPYLEEAAVAVAPVRIGGGFPNKVAEALGASVPLVATSAASAGLPEAISGVHALVADDATAFTSAVLDLLGDPAEAEVMAQLGRSLIQERYRWDVMARQLEACYDQAVEVHLS